MIYDTNILSQVFPDKRRYINHVSFDFLLCLAVATKLRHKTSFTDVPFTVMKKELLAKLDWNLLDNKRVVNKELLQKVSCASSFWSTAMDNGCLSISIMSRNICPKNWSYSCVSTYWTVWKVLSNLDNDNYENSSVWKIDWKTTHKCKLGVLRNVLDDSRISEKNIFGTLKTHAME